MQFTPQKKRITLIITGAMILISLTVLFLIFSWQAFDTRRAADNLENYLLNEFNIAELNKSKQGPSYDHYLYQLIESGIKTIELAGEDVTDFFQNVDLEKYERSAREAESLFLTHCSRSPEDCHPLWSIAPYCMAQWANLSVQNIGAGRPAGQIRENRVFVEALAYWRDYLNNKNWGKEDLSAVLGVVASEQMCGDMKNINIESWSQRTIEVETEAADISQNMRYNYERIQILWLLHDTPDTVFMLPSYEGLERACITPSEKAILQTEDICNVHYYYRIKRFCIETGWREYNKVGEYLKERHSDPEKLICQIGLLHAFRHLLRPPSLRQ